MERGSDKHGARMDDALEHEVHGTITAGHDTHAEEWKSAEPSGEDQPDVDRDPEGTMTGGVPEGMDESDVEGRSELATYLHRSSFPAVREMLIDEAVRNEAPDRVVAEVTRLPAGREFTHVGDVWQALGHHEEAHRF